MGGEFFALIPGQGSPQVSGQPADMVGDALGDMVGGVTLESDDHPNRVVRSTRVATADWLWAPMSRSPSQCPGIAQSAASAGRWEMLIIPRICPRTLRGPQRVGEGSTGRWVASGMIPSARKPNEPVEVVSMRSIPKWWMWCGRRSNR